MTEVVSGRDGGYITLSDGDIAAGCLRPPAGFPIATSQSFYPPRIYAATVKRVRIADDADTDGTLRERTFEDCEVVGPVALVGVGADNQIIDCEYPGTVENLAQVRLGTGPVVFVIGCTLRRCRFALDVDTTELQPLGGRVQ